MSRTFARSPVSATYELRLREFAAQVDASRGRLAELDRASSAEHDPHALLLQTFAELKMEQAALHRAEEALREQVDELSRATELAAVERDRYRELFDEALDGYLVTDATGMVEEVNPAAASMTGVGRRSTRGTSLVTLCSSTDEAKMKDAIADVATGRSIHEFVMLRSDDGESFPVSIRGRLCSEGRLLWVLRKAVPPPADSTEIAVAAAASAVCAEPRTSPPPDVLEMLARERRLRTQLERASAAKDRFLAIICHDLRGPLTAVLGWTQLLQGDDLDPAARQHALATIERNACVQLGLIEDILDVSRLAEEKMQLEFQPVSISTIVTRVADSLTPSARAKGVELVVHPSPVELRTIGDRRRLEQVFTNLLTNATKFTPQGGRIDIVPSSSERDREAIVVVRDTGKGIAGELLPHVFERYRQDDSRAAARGGLGLGLFIVQKLVELHGGKVEAESEGPGRGATFTVRLPLRAVDAPPVATERRPQVSGAELAGRRVLVVDDDDDTREIVAAVLSAHGATLADARDVEAALELVDTFAPDVVVSDIGLDEEDGYALVRRGRERRPGVAYIALSGFAERRYADRALSAGFATFLTKPVDAAALVGAVESAVA